MKTIQEKLIDEYLGIQNDKPKEENVRDKSMNPNYYENDPILQSLRKRYITLVKFGLGEDGKKNLLEYLKRTYPDKTDLEAF